MPLRKEKYRESMLHCISASTSVTSVWKQLEGAKDKNAEAPKVEEEQNFTKQLCRAVGRPHSPGQFQGLEKEA